MSKRTLICDISSSSDDYSDDDELNEFTKQYKAVGLSRRTRAKGLWFSQLHGTKVSKLDDINDPTDRRLQQLLWELGCTFYLFSHQFRGVREVAGVGPNFPGPEMIVKGSNHAKVQARLLALHNASPRFNDEEFGVILADCMGLGKTIQAVAAIVIRNAIAAANGEKSLPSLVVCPNDTVMMQWKEHLLQAGFSKDRIIRLKTKQPVSLESQSNVILSTRYDLQSELRFILQDVENPPLNQRTKKSPLFPAASRGLLEVLLNQYQNANSPVKNRYNEMPGGRKLTNEAVVTKYLRREKRRMSDNPNISKIFRMIIIDEAHFFKNLKTYWSMAAGLICLHSERVGLLTGTPFNNSCQDMAALMTFIDPLDDSAFLSWWKEKMDARVGSTVRQALSDWTSRYLIRREKEVISHLLPKKRIRKEAVSQNRLETYEEHEKRMLDALRMVHYAAQNEKKWLLKEAVITMLGCAACMQLSLLHPVLPNNGRQLTVLFSPSRQKNQDVKSALENESKCVCCDRRIKTVRMNARRNVAMAALDIDNLEDEFGDDMDDSDGEIIFDDELGSDSEEGRAKGRRNKKQRGTGNIVPIDGGLCQLSKHGIRHFACETCIEGLRGKGECCPKCTDLFAKANYVDKDPIEEKTNSDHVYCRDILGGFKASAKLERIVQDVMKISKDQKAMVVSFYKGSLDLLEAMFHEHGVNAVRFDGDVSAEERQACLHEFKTTPSCQVLLMTAQTGGTGLNITEANQGFFTERYWNPMVLDQCEDRLYRIGQGNDVDIAYYDVPLTIDDLMDYINMAKRNNAAIILSDTVALHDARMDYKELSGFLGRALEVLRYERRRGGQTSIKQILDSVIENMRSDNKALPSFLMDQQREKGIEGDGGSQIKQSATNFLEMTANLSDSKRHLDDETSFIDQGHSLTVSNEVPSDDIKQTVNKRKVDAIYGASIVVPLPAAHLPKIETTTFVSPDQKNKVSDEERDFDAIGCQLLAWRCITCNYLNEGSWRSCTSCQQISLWP
ncbi:SNF2-related protein [Nitzschia inconspicua]|uniref:SNF2-related protein n=1 Tax=Nitzschia inconspicua TaxID=303405 RepID=A0A9K3LI00_9STRA|nr:SNF2-related protein [Nitzschia inconspicua]